MEGLSVHEKDGIVHSKASRDLYKTGIKCSKEYGVLRSHQAASVVMHLSLVNPKQKLRNPQYSSRKFRRRRMDSDPFSLCKDLMISAIHEDLT
jgi:hypothetical protein